MMLILLSNLLIFEQLRILFPQNINIYCSFVYTFQLVCVREKENNFLPDVFWIAKKVIFLLNHGQIPSTMQNSFGIPYPHIRNCIWASLIHVFFTQDRMNDDLAVCIVLGNEACDLDSSVSALAYAQFLNQSQKHCTINIPVINVTRSDFLLKTEVVYFLGKFGINFNNLIFR